MPSITPRQLAQTPHGRTLAGMAGAPLDTLSMPLRNSLVFNGATTRVQCGVNGIPIGDSPRTLNAWVKTLSSGGTVIDLNQSGNTGHYALQQLNAGGSWFLLDGGGSVVVSRLVANGPYVPLGVWGMLTFVLDTSTTYRWYANGVLGGAGTFGSPVNTAVLDFVNLGQRQDFTTQNFHGSIAAPRIWNRALRADEVATLFTANVAPLNGLVGEWLFGEGAGSVVADTSGQGNNGTITGATWSSDVPQF